MATATREARYAPDLTANAPGTWASIPEATYTATALSAAEIRMGARWPGFWVRYKIEYPLRSHTVVDVDGLGAANYEVRKFVLSCSLSSLDERIERNLRRQEVPVSLRWGGAGGVSVDDSHDPNDLGRRFIYYIFISVRPGSRASRVRVRHHAVPGVVACSYPRPWASLVPDPNYCPIPPDDPADPAGGVDGPGGGTGGDGGTTPGTGSGSDAGGLDGELLDYKQGSFDMRVGRTYSGQTYQSPVDDDDLLGLPDEPLSSLRGAPSGFAPVPDSDVYEAPANDLLATDKSTAFYDLTRSERSSLAIFGEPVAAPVNPYLPPEKADEVFEAAKPLFYATRPEGNDPSFEEIQGRWETHQAHLDASPLSLTDNQAVEAQCHIKVRFTVHAHSSNRLNYKTLQVFPASTLLPVPAAKAAQLWPSFETIWRLDSRS